MAFVPSENLLFNKHSVAKLFLFKLNTLAAIDTSENSLFVKRNQQHMTTKIIKWMVNECIELILDDETDLFFLYSKNYRHTFF